MSVLIKGMEMPENCTRCDYIGLNVAIGCPVMSGPNGRATDCPLVEVPIPHGRLVEFIDVVVTDDEDTGTEEINLGEALSAYLKMRSAPAVIEAEGEEHDD